jgi:hypothetical protein
VNSVVKKQAQLRVTLILVEMYMALDLDKNGMLSKKEIRKYTQHLFTKNTLWRIFDEYQTYHGELV